jgi:hypothetical protein
MKWQVWLALAAIFYVADTANDNKYSKAVMHYKKYAKPAAVLFGLFSFFLYNRNNPGDSTQMVGHLNSMIRYMPIDQSSKNLIAPFLNGRSEDRILSSGQTDGDGPTARSVSSTKKKYVAASQGWTCDGCKTKLDAWFEVDHKRRLADGGSNHVSNLVALCRNCHGKKTMMEIM